jgi:hypothetical protein
MKKIISALMILLFIGLSGSISLASSIPDQDEELKKKYAPILGEYEFNMGEGPLYLNFYVKEGELWADSGDGRPAVMEPIENEVFKFKADDPETGTFSFHFTKDSQGEYSVCRVVNEMIGFDGEGTKIK